MTSFWVKPYTHGSRFECLCEITAQVCAPVVWGRMHYITDSPVNRQSEVGVPTQTNAKEHVLEAGIVVLPVTLG